VESKLGTAYALKRIHSVDTLPYFRQMLNSEKPSIRQVAVEGFSAFAVHMTIPRDAKDEVIAFDEVMNPGRKKPTSDADAPFDTVDTRKYAHFGAFLNPVQEQRAVDFWTSWYEVNRSLLR